MVTTTTAGLVTACALTGLLVGSFVNVVVWRVPRRESVVRPPSQCPACGSRIRPRDNVPVVSWLLLRGRCRDCRARIPARYPLIEVATAAAFALVAARFAGSWALPAYLVLTAALVAITAIDLEHSIIPNRIVYPAGFATGALLVLGSAGEGDWGALARAAAGSAIFFGSFFVLHVAAPAALGFGDVRLAAVLGAALAWAGWRVLAAGMFLPFLLGSVAGIVVVAPALLAVMAAGAAAGWFAGLDLAERAVGGDLERTTATRALAAAALGVFLALGAFLVLSAARRIERGRALPFGPGLAAGALLALLLVPA